MTSTHCEYTNKHDLFHRRCLSLFLRNWIEGMIGFAHPQRVLQKLRASETGFQRKQQMCQIVCNSCFSVDRVLNS